MGIQRYLCYLLATFGLVFTAIAQPPLSVRSRIYNHYEVATHYAENSLQMAIEEAQKGLSLAEQESYYAGMAAGNMLIGDLYRKNDSSLLDLRRSVTYYVETTYLCQDNLECLARAQYYAGSGYMRFEDYQEAITYLLQSLTLYERLGDTTYQVYTLLKLSETSQASQTWEEVRGYALQAQRLATFAKMDSALTLSLLYIAAQQMHHGSYPQAAAHLAEAIQLAEQGPFPNILAEAKLNLGTLFLRTHQSAQAMQAYQTAYHLFQEQGEHTGKVHSLLGIAEIRLAQQAYPSAAAALDSAVFLAQEHDNLLALQQGYRLSAELALATRQIDQYVSLQKQAAYIQDSINAISQQALIRRLTAQFESEKKELRIQKLEQDQKLQAIELRQQRTQIQFAAVIGILLFVLALVLYQQYRTKQRLSERLEWTVDRRTDQLRKANISLKDLNEELDTFAYRTAHDIRGPVARLLGLCQVAMEENGGGQVHRFVQLIHQEATQMDFMLHRFLEVNSIKHQPRKVEPVNLSESLEQVLEQASHLEASKRISIIKELPSHLEIVSDPDLVRIILKNLIENAILFSNKSEDARPYIAIEGEQVGKFVEIKVKDNGIGIDSEVAPRIFEMFFRGTTVSKGLGLGLYATQIATQELKGGILLNEEALGETEFVLRLPRSLDLSPPD